MLLLPTRPCWKAAALQQASNFLSTFTEADQSSCQLPKKQYKGGYAEGQREKISIIFSQNLLPLSRKLPVLHCWEPTQQLVVLAETIRLPARHGRTGSGEKHGTSITCPGDNAQQIHGKDLRKIALLAKLQSLSSAAGAPRCRAITPCAWGQAASLATVTW